jgi:hypothetical protein
LRSETVSIRGRRFFVESHETRKEVMTDQGIEYIESILSEQEGGKRDFWKYAVSQLAVVFRNQPGRGSVE